MWIVIGIISFHVGYGVDSSTYIFGICDTKESAERLKIELKSRNEEVVLIDGEPQYSIDRYENEGPAKYKDVIFSINEFTGEPLYIGGAQYME